MGLLLVLAALALAGYGWSQLDPRRAQMVMAGLARLAPARPAAAPLTAPAPARSDAPRAPARQPATTLTWPLVRARLDAWSRSTRAWLIAGTVAIGLYAWWQFLAVNYAWAVMALWLGALCGFLALVAGPPTWRWGVPRAEWVVFGALMLVGIALRLYRLADVPFGLNHDAAYGGLVALKAMNTPSYIPWSPDPAAGETFFDYWVLGFIYVLGPVPLAIKGAAALAGIAGLAAMYLMARRLFDPRVAAIATALLATSGWQLIFSRVGWRLITLPLVEALAFYFLFRAFETRRRGSFAAAGALLALQLNTYLAGRVVPIIAVLWALVELWRAEDRRTLLQGYLLALASFLFAGASILAFAYTNPDAFGSRYNAVSIVPQLLAGDWAPLWQNLQTSLGLFTVKANGNDFFLNQPLLDWPAQWLFLIGLAIALWRAPHARRYTFLLVALALSLVPGMISIAPNGNRATAAMPFVYVLAALPLAALIEPGSPLRRRVVAAARWTAAHWLPEAVVAVVLLVTLVGTFNQYLGPNRTELWGFYPETTVVGRYIRQIDGRFDSYLTDNFPRDALTYTTYQAGDPIVGIDGPGYPYQPHYTWYDTPQPFLSATPRPGRGTAFFMFDGNPMSGTIVQQLRARYPRTVAFTLIYRDDSISRPAAIVILVPPPGASASSFLPANRGPLQ